MINSKSSVPMYIQLKNQIEAAIKDGYYIEGDKLPSEKELCTRYHVSRITVRQALSEMEKTGLIYTSQGKGTFVKSAIIRNELFNMVSFEKTVQNIGQKAKTIIIASGLVNDAEKARLLHREPQDAVYNISIIGYADEMPIVFYNSFILPERGEVMLKNARMLEAENKAFSTYDLYKTSNIDVTDIAQILRAVNADPVLAKKLEVPEGFALVKIISHVYASNNQLIEYKEAYYRSDKYSFALRRQVI